LQSSDEEEEDDDDDDELELLADELLGLAEGEALELATEELLRLEDPGLLLPIEEVEDESELGVLLLRLEELLRELWELAPLEPDLPVELEATEEEVGELFPLLLVPLLA
jgi:hypothetical protein